jgi:hypothetical protein
VRPAGVCGEESTVPQSDIELKRWKRLEYEQLVEKGVFGAGDRVELIGGLLP